MKNKIKLLLIIGLFTSNMLSAQSFTKQVLNKGSFPANITLLQDYDSDGDLDIIASRTSPRGIYVLENDHTKQFPATPIITENLAGVVDLDIADIDNDGDLDYVICFGSELSWFQRQNDGTYIKWTIQTNKSFDDASLEDLNNDGWIDIAVVGGDGRIYINQGNLFFNEVTIATGDLRGSVDAADIDNDGDIDIALGGDHPASSNLGSRLMLNDGNGNFSVGTYLSCWSGFYNYCGISNMEIVDLNGDGFQDIVTYTAIQSGGLYFLDGSNGFNSTKIDNLGIDIGGHFVIYDIDNNGLLDIIRQDNYRDRMSILYQNSPLQFTREVIDVNWEGGVGAFGDLDNDGDLDHVLPSDGDAISWLENINGQLYRHQVYAKLDGARTTKMVDWDNDGDLDVFATVASATEDELILYENIDGLNFINWRLHDFLNQAADIEFADIDGDGDLDIFATATAADDLVWLRNDGFQANWETATIFSVANGAVGIAAGDIDDDGDEDVILCTRDDDKVFGFKNDGLGNFNIFVVDALVENPSEVVIADLDDDGDQDIALVAASTSNSVVVYHNDGDENFNKDILMTNEIGHDIEIGDWDQDGSKDIFACFSSSLHVVGFLKNGGNYDADTFFLQNDDVFSLKLSDIDLDGDLDMITGHDWSAGLPELYVNINKQYTIEHIISLMHYGDVVSIDDGDINSDGIIDIVLADNTGDNLILLTMDCILSGTICDDNDSFTLSDQITDNCQCQGTSMIQNNCTDLTLNITDNPISQGIYDAIQTVTSTGVVANSTTVSHIAGNDVNMNIGFTVEANASFVADIVDCPILLYDPKLNLSDSKKE